MYTKLAIPFCEPSGYFWKIFWTIVITNKKIYYKFIAKSRSVKYSEFFDEKGGYKSVIKNYDYLVKLNKSKNEYIIEYQLIIKIYNLNKEKVCEYEINFPLIEKTSPLIDNK